MTDNRHRNQDPNQGVHLPYSWTYADAAARLAHTPTDGPKLDDGVTFVPLTVVDNGKLARQLDTNALYMLADFSVPTWLVVTNPGGVPAHASTHSDGGSDPVTVENLATGSTTTTHVLSPDGVGGLVMRAESGGVTAHSALTGLGADDHTQYQLRSEKDVASGYAGLDVSSKLDGAQQVYGSATNTAAEGDDSRILTQAENDAAQGTNGTPSGANRYVTDSDPRNSDARAPTAHGLGSAAHTSATLAELNALVSDATLDDSSGTRPPTAHALGGSDHTASTLAQLNTRVSDATLDDSSASRTPTTHASSHQNGGGDEINVAGLSGVLADAQTPAAHALGGAAHTSATLAELNALVSDATLDDSAAARTPTSHAASHQNGGGDEINVAGLSGQLADDQPALAHAIGGSTHTASTLADLNALVSDATLDDSSASRTPTAHASSHARAGTDEIDGDTLDIDYVPTNYTRVVTPAEVTNVAELTAHLAGVDNALASSGGAGLSDIVIDEHWATSNADQHEMGKHGWAFNANGSGNSRDFLGLAGRPGILQLTGGTAATGRHSVYIGASNEGILPFVVGGANEMVVQFVMRFTSVVTAAALSRINLGFRALWNNNADLADGVAIRVVGGATPVFEAVTANASTRSVVTGTTTVVQNTWYTVGFTITDPTSSPSVSLQVDGSDEGTPVTTNIPSVGLGFGHAIHASGGGGSPIIQVDRSTFRQQAG